MRKSMFVLLTILVTMVAFTGHIGAQDQEEYTWEGEISPYELTGLMPIVGNIYAAVIDEALVFTEFRIVQYNEQFILLVLMYFDGSTRPFLQGYMYEGENGLEQYELQGYSYVKIKLLDGAEEYFNDLVKQAKEELQKEREREPVLDKEEASC